MSEPISDVDLWLCRQNLPGQLDSPILVTKGQLAEFGLRLIARLDALADRLQRAEAVIAAADSFVNARGDSHPFPRWRVEDARANAEPKLRAALAAYCASTDSCTHESASGIDQTAFNDQDKVWRCDACGWLFRCALDDEGITTRLTESPAHVDLTDGVRALQSGNGYVS